MFINVRELTAKLPAQFRNPCEVAGFGHTTVDDDPRLRNVSQEEFIREFLSDDGRTQLFGHNDPSDEEIAAKAAKCREQTGIPNRAIFSSGVELDKDSGLLKEINAGTTTELAVIAAHKCLESAGVLDTELDAIICGTNTGPGYPSIADRVKEALGDSRDSHAECHDLTEACTAGAIAVKQRASLLAPFDKWKLANLFGDGAFAMLLVRGYGEESFIFFDTHSIPWGRYLKYIYKDPDGSGFHHEGNNVHKFVGNIIRKAIIRAIEQANIDIADIDHLVPHQPSNQTLELLQDRLGRTLKFWSGDGPRPDDHCLFHNCVADTGNLSSASTGWLMSHAIQNRIIRFGDLVLVATFGSGMSGGFYAFHNTIR